MLNKVIGLLNLFLLCFITSCYAGKTEKPVVAISTWQTTNGVPVYFAPSNTLPMVDIRVIFSAGSVRDGQQPGIANFALSMLDEGTKKYTSSEIAMRLDNIGAEYSANINNDYAYVHLRSLTDKGYLTPATDVFHQIISAPTFVNKEFSRIKQQILSLIKYEQQNPSSVMRNAFYSALYPEYLYGHATNGTKQSVESLTAKQVQKFYQHYYVASNAMVVIVGGVNKTQAKALAEKLVGHLPAGVTASKLVFQPKTPQSLSKHIPFPSTQTHVMIGQVAINRHDPDYFPLVVGNHVLGGGGLVSVLFDKVRDKRGLAYSVYSALSPLAARGPFLLKLETKNSSAEQAILIAKDTLKQFIAHGPNEKQLADAKQNLIGSFPISLATNRAIISVLSRIAFYHLPLNYLDTYRDNVRKVTNQRVITAFQKHIDPSHMVTVTVGK